MPRGDSEKPRLNIVNLRCLYGIFRLVTIVCASLLVVHSNGQATPRINLRPKRLKLTSEVASPL